MLPAGSWSIRTESIDVSTQPNLPPLMSGEPSGNDPQAAHR